MEPDTSALSSACLDLHPLPVEVHEINTEFCDESVMYSEVKVLSSSNIKRKTTKNLKTNGWSSFSTTWGSRKLRFQSNTKFPWCLVAIIFAFLYLIFLGLAAVMIAKVRCLEGILMTEENLKQNGTTYCKII